MSRTKYEGEPESAGQLKEFTVVVEWKMRGVKRVRARSLKEAADMTADLELPRGEYVDDSFEPDIQDSDSGYERTCDADEKPSVVYAENGDVIHKDEK